MARNDSDIYSFFPKRLYRPSCGIWRLRNRISVIRERQRDWIRDIRACYTETLQSEANHRHRDITRGRWAGIESVFSVAKDVEETETTQHAKRIILINSSSRLWLVVRLGP